MNTDSPCDPKVIVALDFAEDKAAIALVEKLDPAACKLKVGKELFTSAGPQLVRRFVDDGFDLFLDLKFHDIPNTVAKAVSAAADLGVWMCNVHASGGRRMMEASRAALVSKNSNMLLIAVTVLTSMAQEDLDELGVNRPASDQVLHLARLTQSSGLDGVVCSAMEAQLLKKELGADFKLVTPGIRPAGSAADDQRRIVTPQDALSWGSDYLVIGRPITGAADPLAALYAINESMFKS